MLKYIGFLIFLLFLSCDESDDNPLTNITDVLSREDLKTLNDQINFEVNMADGGTAIFSSSKHYTNISEVNFTEMGSNEYAENSSVLIELEGGYEFVGHIKFKGAAENLIENTTFNYSFCTTYESLRLNYPHLEISSSLDEFTLVMGFDIHENDVLDFLDDQDLVGNVLAFVVHPSGYLFFAEYTTFDNMSYWLIDDSFEISGSKYTSKGEVQPNPLSYEFEISCP